MSLSSQIPANIKSLVNLRDGGHCLNCGGPAHDIHHRNARGMGGSSDPAIHHPSNLVSLCRPCHNYFEGNPTVARKLGWKLSGKFNTKAPETVAIVDLRDRSWLLDDVDGAPVRVRVETVRGDR